jgi:hypothetical protein
MKRKKNKEKSKEENTQKLHRDNSRTRKTKHRKSRHSEKKLIKDMMDICTPDEYEDYTEYMGWDD